MKYHKNIWQRKRTGAKAIAGAKEANREPANQLPPRGRHVRHRAKEVRHIAERAMYTQLSRGECDYTCKLG